MAKNSEKFTPAGTNIEEVKRQNALAGNGKFNEQSNLKEEFATEIFSQSISSPSAGKTVAGTDIQKVREEIAEESNVFPQSSNYGIEGKTPAGTDIQKVREEIAQESNVFPQSSNYGSEGKTPAGTDIQKVKEEIAEESGIFPQSTKKQK